MLMNNLFSLYATAVRGHMGLRVSEGPEPEEEHVEDAVLADEISKRYMFFAPLVIGRLLVFTFTGAFRDSDRKIVNYGVRPRIAILIYYLLIVLVMLLSGVDNLISSVVFLDTSVLICQYIYHFFAYKRQCNIEHLEDVRRASKLGKEDWNQWNYTED